ncbi:MAG: hypothetical protein OHK0017_09820 [Patescibacteria group bacterium]
MTNFFSKKLNVAVGLVALTATMFTGVLTAHAINAPEASRPDNTVKLTVLNYKFNFETYFQDKIRCAGVAGCASSTPYDSFDPAGGSRAAYVIDNFTCANGAKVGGVPLLGLYETTVDGTTYTARGDLNRLQGVNNLNYCNRSSIGTIFNTITYPGPNGGAATTQSSKNDTNLLPQIFNVTNTTSYYAPARFDTAKSGDGLCYRQADGSIQMNPTIAAKLNDPNAAVRKAWQDVVGTRNCNPGPELREIYQFRYVIEYPSNALCNQYYDTNNDGRDTYGTGSGQIDCPTYFAEEFGKKRFGIESNKGIVATSTWHRMINESSTDRSAWRKVESGSRVQQSWYSSDPSWDGKSVFPLK